MSTASRLGAVLGGLVLALGAVELVARTAWQHRPAVVDQCLSLDHTGSVDGRLPPGEHGVMNTRFSGTDQGLRSNGSPPPATGPRVLLVGDSFTFGVAMADAQTISAQAEAALLAVGSAAHVANGGQLALALSDEVRRAGPLVEEIHPDVLLLMLTGNDFDRIGSAQTPGVELTIAPTHHFERSALAMLGEAMVPRCTEATGPLIRASRALARGSAAWHYLGLHLANAGVRPVPRAQSQPVGQMPAAVAQPVWEQAIAQPLEQLRQLGEQAGVPVGLIVHDTCQVEGQTALALYENIDKQSIPVLDLSALHPCAEPRSWDLGWDGHPNAAANAESGRALAAWLVAQGWVEGPAPPAPALASASELRAHHEAIAEASRAAADRAFGRLGPVLDAQVAGPDDQPDHYPWGWWPGTAGQAAWMASHAAVVLGPAPQPSQRLLLSGVLASGQSQLRVHCPGHLGPTRAQPRGRSVQLRVALQTPLPAGAWLSCILEVDRPADREGRLLGFGLQRVELSQ